MITHVSIKALRRLPPNGKFIKTEEGVEDMGGEKHNAIVWAWLDDRWPARMIVRKGYFDIETGEYIGETLSTILEKLYHELP